MKARQLFLVFSFPIAICFASTSGTVSSTTPQAKMLPGEKGTATNSIPNSVFIIPTNPSQGRDPFFPNSTRLLAKAEVTNAPQENLSSNVPLTLQGISGVAGRRLAIINGRTLAENEEAEIAVGPFRVTVRCLEIRLDSVVVETGNVRRELRLRTNN